MVLVIQVLLIFLACLVFWCEQTKFFANTFKSVLFRFIISTSLIGLCYHIPIISYLEYTSQFAIMGLVILVTFLTSLLTLQRYNHNKSKHEIKINQKTFKSDN